MNYSIEYGDPDREKWNEELADLYVKEKALETTLDFWQNRKADFLGIYRPFLSGPADYWLARENGSSRLLGCMASVPLHLRLGDLKHPIWQGVDLMVAPDCRGEQIAFNLFKAHGETAKLSGDPFCIFYGVEQDPGVDTVGKRIFPRYGYHFDFYRSSRLDQVFLTENVVPKEVKGISLFQLKDVPQKIQESFSQCYFECSQKNFLNLLPGERYFEKLLKMDPEAKMIVYGPLEKMQGGGILFSQRKVRQFISTGRNSLILERLKRKFSLSSWKGQELKTRLCGWTWVDEQSAESDAREIFRKIFLAACFETEKKGDHCLVFRDECIDAINDLPGDHLRFQRRVFFSWRLDHPDHLNIKKIVEDSNYPSKLEVGLL